MVNLPHHLLDDLRHATEFYRCVEAETAEGADCVATGAWEDARAWLKSAALALGDALIAAKEGSEVPHA